jgi:hypothetical protein
MGKHNKHDSSTVVAGSDRARSPEIHAHTLLYIHTYIYTHRHTHTHTHTHTYTHTLTVQSAENVANMVPGLVEAQRSENPKEPTVPGTPPNAAFVLVMVTVVEDKVVFEY